MTVAQRFQLLREWRRMDDAPASSDRFVELSAVAREEFNRLGLIERFDETAVSKVWRSVVGDFVADHTQIVGLQAGKLTVAVLQPALRYELDCVAKSGVLKKLRGAGKLNIREIAFVLR